MQKIILELSTSELIASYNNLSKTQVTKFKDRKTAEARVSSLAIAEPKLFLNAMIKAKVRQELIDAFEKKIDSTINARKEAIRKDDLVKDQVPTPKEGKNIKPTKKVDTVPEEVVEEVETDPFKIAAKKLLKQQAEMKKQEEEAAGPEAAAIKSSKKPKKVKEVAELDNNSKAAGILWHLQNYMKQKELKGEKELTTTSTEVARIAITSIKESIKQLDILKKLGYVSIEDDTTGEGDTFYYVTLTEKGKQFILKPSDPNAPKKEKAAKLAGAAPGPRSTLAGKKIYRLTKTNPRREGSCGYKSFAVIRDGMTFEEYIEQGGRSSDLRWDVDHGFTELK